MVNNSPRNGDNCSANKKKKFLYCFLILLGLMFIFRNFNSILMLPFKTTKLPEAFVVTQALKLNDTNILLFGYDSYRIKYKKKTGGYGYIGQKRDFQRYSDTYIYNSKSKNLLINNVIEDHKYDCKISCINNNDSIILFGSWKEPIKNNSFLFQPYEKSTNIISLLKNTNIPIYKVNLNNLSKSNINFTENYVVKKIDDNRAFILTDSYSYIYDTKNYKIINKNKNDLKIIQSTNPIKISKNKYLLFGLFYLKDVPSSVMIFNIDDLSVKMLGKIKNIIYSSIKNNNGIYCFPNRNNNLSASKTNTLQKYDIQTNTFKDLYEFYGLATQDIYPIQLKSNKILIVYKPTTITFIPPLFTWQIPISPRCEIFDSQTGKIKKILMCPNTIVTSPIVLDNGDVVFIQKNSIKTVPEKYLK